MNGDMRYMWILVLFDLPTTSNEHRKQSTRFRNYLVNDGYLMLQFSVYARVCKGQDAVDKHLARLRTALPPQGHIRALQVTDKQYARMQLLLGTPLPDENEGTVQLLLL